MIFYLLLKYYQNTLNIETEIIDLHLPTFYETHINQEVRGRKQTKKKLCKSILNWEKRKRENWKRKNIQCIYILKIFFSKALTWWPSTAVAQLWFLSSRGPKNSTNWKLAVIDYQKSETPTLSNRCITSKQ